MRVFNSYTNQLENFESIHPNIINMYVCGPTVYNYIHVGNARPVVFFDMVRRFFEKRGFKVNFASNFTDIDDRIIQKAFEEGKNELAVSQFYIDAFLKDLHDLNCKTDYIKPRVTEYMDNIKKYIQEMIDNGYAYVIDGDVYFVVEKIKDYGKLSNRNIDDLISGSRIEINHKKKSPLDFTLWKKTDTGINFDSPFSKGRPGWHTECVAMIDDIFHEKIDIHGGGMDLQFPHHENEIAQSKATHNHCLANYWLHNGRLSFKNEKMSKSLGNVVFVKDVTEKMPLRYFLLSTHYRAPLNYDDDVLEMYQKEWQKLENSVKSLFFKLDLESVIDQTVNIEDENIKREIENFNSALEDDFNSANAITAMQALIRQINSSLRRKFDAKLFNQFLVGINYMMDVLGLKLELKSLSVEDRKLYESWQNARNDLDFDKADKLRDELIERGFL